MLQLSSSLLNREILSLRTGGVIGRTVSPIINPNNLKVEGFYCTDVFDRKKMLILLYQDIRDVIPQGIVVNDHEALVEPNDLVRLRDLMQLHFDVMNKQVVSTTKAKIGKVVDFAVEVETMYIQKLYAAPSVFKNLTGGNLSIDRSQIVEITSRKIVIQDLSGKVPAGLRALA